MMNRQFRELERKAMRRIAEGAKSNDIGLIARMTRTAQACKDAQSQLNALESLLISIAAELDSVKPKGAAAVNPASGKSTPVTAVPAAVIGSCKGKEISAKARGNEMRRNWLLKHEVQGLALRRLRSVIYQTAAQGRVGIASATERPKHINKWFLGLPDKHYDAAVLLCQDQSGEVLDFVLPEKFVSNIWNLLGRSEGQVKFHVERDGVNHALRIPGGGSREINSFLANYSPLR